MRWLASVWLIALCSGGFAQETQQAWPTRTVRIVVPTPAGGPADAVARIISNALGEQVSQPVIVENKSGAGGNIAVESVAQTPNDHVLLLGLSTLVSNPFFYQGSRDPRELAPVVQLTSGYFVLLASTKFEPKDPSELMAMARGRSGIRCGSTGGLATLACELLRVNSGGNISIVSYRGIADSVRDLQGGDIDLLLDFVNSAQTQVRAGRARPLGVASREKGVEPFATVEAMNTVIPDFEFYGWHAILVHKDTPPGVVRTMNAVFNKALATSDLKEKFRAISLDVVGGEPDRLARQVAFELAQFERITKAAGIKPQ